MGAVSIIPHFASRPRRYGAHPSEGGTLIGAGTIINPILKVVTTVAILGAAYIFIVKPVLDTTENITGEVAEQTRQTLARLDAVLRTAGGSLADVVSVTAYLQDIGDWDAFNRAYGEAFTPPFPTRTTVGVALGDVLVEISAVAYLPR